MLHNLAAKGLRRPNLSGFLQTHTSTTARCDIFWRFVAGSTLRRRGATLNFFEAIEQERRDLLGPTHQRLVMHCLGEIERNERVNFHTTSSKDTRSRRRTDAMAIV